MKQSNQIKDSKLAEKYYKMLDVDKNGSVSFSEFLAPILPHLAKDQISRLTESERYSCDDLTLLRNMYAELR